MHVCVCYKITLEKTCVYGQYSTCLLDASGTEGSF
jgi:hypothetical protein